MTELDKLFGDEPGRAPSVVDGVWKQSSVTQLKSLSLCVLKWWLEKVKRYKRKPASKGMLAGLKGHTELEHYLKTGQDAMGPEARAGKLYLPLPARVELAAGAFQVIPGLLIEHRFDGQAKGAPFNAATALLKAGDVPLDGFIDVVNARFLAEGGELYGTGNWVDKGTLVLSDHKFTKDVDAYGSHEHELVSVDYEHGIQMIGYAEWARLMLATGLFPAFERVLLQHITYQWYGRHIARQVSALVDLAHVEREWFKVNSLASTGVDAAKETDVLKIPYNEGACSAYGGCDFLGVCPRSPLNRTFNNPGKEEDPMNILDQMFGGPPGAPPTEAAPVAPPAPPVPVVPPAPPAPVQSLPLPAGWIYAAHALPGQVYFVQAYGKPMRYVGADPVGTLLFETGDHRGNVPLNAVTHVFPIAAPPVAPTATPGTAVVGVGADGRPLPALLPPDAPASNPLTSSTPTVPVPPDPATEAAKKAEKEAVKAAKKAAKAAAAPQQLPPIAGTVSYSAPAAPPVPTVGFQAPAGPVQAFEQSTAQALDIPTSAPTSIPAPAAPVDFLRTKLYLGCRPDAGAVRIDDYANGLVEKLCARYGVAHPQIVPRDGTGGQDKNHPLAMGGWKGLLSGVVRLAPPPPGSYFVGSFSETTEVIANALAGLLPAENVIRAG